MPTLEALSRYRFAGKSERAVREEWIRPLLEHLGYGIDTLNDVRFEERLALRNPRRRIGSETRIVDYVPTVLGHGLWIIEAKAPEARDSWDEAISQGWLYATHPEVDVPLMAVADGKRLAVYDVTSADWDRPVIELAAGELRERFDDLLGVLGAAQVAARVRERQLRHLASAMRAELDPIRLDETVESVRRLAHEARPSVIENRRRVLVDQHKRENADRDELVRSAGVWGIAQMHNQPVSDNLRDADRAAEYVRSLPEDLRSCELDLFVEAARPTIDSSTGERVAEPGEPRMFWFLRVLALATYVRLRSTPGVAEHAEQLARSAVRDHLLNFPDDPLARAAHRLERVLPPFTLRMALSLDQVDMPAAAQRMRAPMDDEQRLRAGVDGDELLLRTVIISARRAFASLDWDEAALNQAAETLERVVPRIQYRTDSAMGQAHDPFMEFYLAVDPLLLGTLLVIGSDHTDLLDDNSERVVRGLAEQAEGALAVAARRVAAARDDSGGSTDPVTAE